MKIKKVELVGFKSFVDRTVLHFDHDVMGIVGPNGCGKSNIVDAIRWCMGEQSAKHLRGRSMEDVLFSGSESRAGNDFAEVTLTFVNDNPSEMPLEYRDYAEVAVTRRLHRSGESEYLVNKTPVRLRDVTDLFLGTGAGTKAYSIVEQGKVGLIVSAKPEDRRLLIEEAAGITKFKSRKKQAEKKMELTQQNLLRVGDIVAEIDRNLASLKRQAAKAERYVGYRHEVEDLQLHEASHRYLELVGWQKLESAEVERLTLSTEEVRGQLVAREADLETARLEAHAAEERLEAAQNAAFAAENQVRIEEAAIERARDRLTALTQREQRGQGEKLEMVEQATRLRAERDLVAREVEGLAEEEVTRATEATDQEAVLGRLSDSYAECDARVGSHRSSIGVAQADIASAEAKLSGFDRRCDEMTTRLGRVRLEQESLDVARVEHVARIEELARRIDDLRVGRVTTAAEKVLLEAQLVATKERLRAEEQAVEEAKGDLSTSRSRLAALEEMHARLEGVGAGTKALVLKRDPCLAGLVADRVEAPAELTQALAAVLGARLEDVVVSDLDRAMELLEELARDKKGRATVVPHAPAFVAGRTGPLAAEGVVGSLVDLLRFAPEDEALVRAVVGEAVVVRDRRCAASVRRSGFCATIVTLDGTVLHADGRVSGGQGDELAAGMIDGKREARELAEAVARLDGLVTTRLGALQASRAELARTGAALDAARHQDHTSELALVSAEKDRQKSESQLEGIVARIESLVAEQAEITTATAQATLERAEVERSLGAARALLESSLAELAEAETALGAARASLDEQRRAVTTCKVAIAALRERLAAARGTEARVARSAVELDERSERLEEELLENARAFGEAAASIVKHRETLQAALDASREAQGVVTTVRTEFDQVRTDLQAREGVLRDLRASVDGLREELGRHEMALREKQLALEHLLAGVAEKFRGVHLPRVIGDYHLRPPPDESMRERIDELVKLIDRMGSVNLDAVREHAEAEERFTFYTTQKADLEKALGDLTRAIQQMNRESRRLFEDTFEAVNARFREIFPRMFRGGRAELRMTNPEDLLETGIDIVAQPPGKKLSSIELMSGGEKALTAVSLIFAIFQIKPSPFCILDEVDAPLDEANVARYNEMIRSMTHKSQFILITHVKRTMQLVDVLYGVTMPEAGVSKIVSVKLNESSSAQRSAPPEAAVA